MSDPTHIPVLILGGGTGGVAAALALAKCGVRCLVAEPSQWLGGQLTSQAVPPDENKWIEGINGIRSAPTSYLNFRNRVREYYKLHTGIRPQAGDDPLFNPGGGWVSRLCFAPCVGVKVINQMLAEPVKQGIVSVLLQHEPIAAEVRQESVTSVTLLNMANGDEIRVEADLVLDATETGDLYPLAGIEHHIGAEHRDDYNEMHGRVDHADPLDQQAITWCFAMEHRPGEEHVIDKPKGYDKWRNYQPPLDPPWPGPLFSWDICDDAYKPRTLGLTPWPDEPEDGQWELWRYRRIVDRSIYPAGSTAPPDVSLFNCVQMDYFLKPLLGVSKQDRQIALEEAREQSLCFFYWMQTEAPRHDDKPGGYPGLKLRGDELGSKDGFALMPYIREPRRLDARTMITEAHVGQQQRLENGGIRINEDFLVAGEPFPDSVGIGHYPIDLHPSTAMRNSIYIPAAPFRVPLGALLPKRIKNVIAAGKALGATHIANGCTRLHPIEWTVGEAAGNLAAMCVQEALRPTQVHDDASLLRSFQNRLVKAGVPLTWPWEEA